MAKFDKNGFDTAAFSTRYAAASCVKLSSYKYITNEASYKEQSWLKGISSGNNAIGLNYAYTYWGTDKGYDPNNYFKYNGAKLPLCLKENGKLPYGQDDNTYCPFSYILSSTEFTLVRYNTTNGYIEYSHDNNNWYYLTSGVPGIFFILVGGGGSGANGRAYALDHYGGGGGGGGAAAFGYLDLKAARDGGHSTYYFNVAQATEYPEGEGSSGIDGNASYIGCGIFNLVTVGGGKAGRGWQNTPDGGAGGSVLTENTDKAESKYLALIEKIAGCKGGSGGSPYATAAAGDSFTTVAFTSKLPLKTDYIPKRANKTSNRGIGTSKSTGDPDGTAAYRGGGGGASICSNSDQAGYYGGGGKGGWGDESGHYDWGGAWNGRGGILFILTAIN